MARKISTQAEVDSMGSPTRKAEPARQPQVLTVAELLALEVPEASMLIENLLPFPGACLLFGPSKSGKTLLAIQAALAVAGGHPLFRLYRIENAGPVMVVEQDDPAGPASVRTILQRSGLVLKDLPFVLAPKLPFTFGPELIAWLEDQIRTRSLRLVVLDSYTALRSSRNSGVDIVKVEQTDLTMLDELAKRTRCTLLIIHHASKGSAGMDWSDQAAGTFAMSAATEAQIHISRFRDLEASAPERLVRVRGRHLEGAEFVLRFLKATLNYEHVLEGGASSFYPLIVQLRTLFGEKTFSPKQLKQATGASEATASRQLARLLSAGALEKRGYGEYVLAAK